VVLPLSSGASQARMPRSLWPTIRGRFDFELELRQLEMLDLMAENRKLRARLKQRRKRARRRFRRLRAA
jgi:ATP-dependent protease HslVU (ClpYQ) ATPase subunit